MSPLISWSLLCSRVAQCTEHWVPCWPPTSHLSSFQSPLLPTTHILYGSKYLQITLWGCSFRSQALPLGLFFYLIFFWNLNKIMSFLPVQFLPPLPSLPFKFIVFSFFYYYIYVSICKHTYIRTHTHTICWCPLMLLVSIGFQSWTIDVE